MLVEAEDALYLFADEKGTSLPIHHAVLAMLSGGPSYGYELKSKFERAIGPQWGELNIGHIYQVLERLERDGFVTQRRVSQLNRPDRAVFRVTKSGRAELDRWLESPFVRQSGYRDDLFLKLFSAALISEDMLGKVIKTQRQAYLSELAALGALRKDHRDPLVSLLIEAAIQHTDVNIRILDKARRNAKTLAARAKQESRPSPPQESTAS
jgi:DNA-binding PadR family transcriptional regulator